MDNKLNEQKWSKRLTPLKNSLTKVLTLLNLSELDYVNEALADFENYTINVIADGIKFLESLQELSHQKMNFNNLHAAAAFRSNTALSIIQTSKISTNEHIIKFDSINNELEKFLSSFTQQILEELDLQYQQIEDNHKELLGLIYSSHKFVLYNKISPVPVSRELLNPPPETIQVDPSVLIEIHLVRKQYSMLIAWVDKCPLKEKICESIINKIMHSLEELSSFTSNQQLTLEDKKKLTPSKEYKIRIPNFVIPKNDKILKILIDKFNEQHIYLSAAQIKFRKALDKFPQQLSERPPDLSEAVKLLRKLEQSLQSIALYADKENINLKNLLGKYEKVIIDFKIDFKKIGKLLRNAYTTIDSNYQELQDLQLSEESTLNLIQRCALLKEFSEKFPHRGRQDHINHLQAIIEALNLKIQESVKLIPGSPKNSISTNLHKFSYSNSSSASTAISLTSNSTSPEIIEISSLNVTKT